MTTETPKRIHYLYRITNRLNGKIYIGQTVEPNKRWYQHRRDAAHPTMIIGLAIKKYGAANFDFEIIAGCKSWDDANQTETLLVAQYNSLVPNGYNVALGGMNAPKSETWKQKMREWHASLSPTEKEKRRVKLSKARIGIEYSEETILKMKAAKSGINNPNYGKKNSRETLKKRVASLIGKKRTIESKKKMSAVHIMTTPGQEKEIYNKFMAGHSINSLSKEFGVNRSVVRRIIKNSGT